MTDPSEQALPFSEAAREAATQTLRYLDTHGVLSDGWAPMVLAAAVKADPRLNAFLGLAALSDAELRHRVVLALEGCVEIEEAVDAGADLDSVAQAVLADLGLPVAEQEPKPAWCPIHQHHKWCEHNGGVMSAGGWVDPVVEQEGTG